MQVQKLQALPMDKPWGELSTRLSSVQLSMSLPLTATPQVSLAGKQLCGGHPAGSRLPGLSAAGRWPATPRLAWLASKCVPGTICDVQLWDVLLPVSTAAECWPALDSHLAGELRWPLVLCGAHAWRAGQSLPAGCPLCH